MTLRTALRMGVLVCVLCAFGAFGVAEHQPVLALLLSVTASIGWWMTEWKAAGDSTSWQGLPRWFTNVLLLLIVGFAVFNALRLSTLVTTFATLLACVLVVKLWQVRRPTDYGQLLTMSLFLTVASVLSDNSIATGFMVLVQTPILVASAMVYHIWLARERAGGPGATPQIEKGVWKRVRAPLTLTTLSTLAIGVSIATAVFLVMPRGILFPQFRALSRPAVGRTVGFTNQIDLSAGAPQEQSTVIVMTAQVRSRSREQESLGSAEKPAYLRGAILDSYRRGRWSASPTPPDRLQSGTIQIIAGNGNITQTVEQPTGGPFPTTDTVIQPRVSLTDPAQAFSVGRGYRWEFGSQVDVRLDERFGCLTYTTPSMTGSYTVACTTVPIFPEEYRRGQVTFPDPAVRAFAERVLRDENIEPDPALREQTEDAAAVSAFAAYLRTHFSYSRDAGPAPIEQPVSWFLEKEKKGHCEYFASALAALCRSVGIDAHVVAGYLATEYDPTGGDNGAGAYVVRASDAHAWVEANTAPGVWRTFDATPEGNPGFRERERDTFASILDRLAWNLEDLWNSRVVSYDRATQERLLSVQNSPGGLAGLISSYLEVPPRQRVQRATRLLIPVIACLVLFFAMSAAAVWFIRRARAKRLHADTLIPGWALAAAHPEAQRLYQQVRTTLARLGVQPRAGTTLRDAVHDARLPEAIAPPLVHATNLLYHACYAGRPDPQAMAQARKQVRAIP